MSFYLYLSHYITVVSDGLFIRDLCLFRDDYNVIDNCAIMKHEQTNASLSSISMIYLISMCVIMPYAFIYVYVLYSCFYEVNKD